MIKIKLKMITEITTDKMYLSEVLDKLPSKTLLNKGITGCGGTYVELHSERNSIILVPTIELAKNKSKDGFLVYGKVDDKDIIKYINSDIKYKKIIGTYDSFKRLVYLVDPSYFLLIDEYHILFNSYSFRSDAILYLLNNYQLFDDYCFMTATPLNDDIILDEIKHLPKMVINWEKSVRVKLNILDVSFTNKELLKLLNYPENCNYHIFLNSVSTIRELITKTNISDYRVICSETSKRNIKTLKTGSTLDQVCKYNFYTATAFEGCDIFDPIGKTIILCDTNISTTILDISTLIRQISGRLRDSIYKDEITIILNTTKHRYAGTSLDEFNLKVKENIKLGKYTEQKFNIDTDSLYKEKELRSFSIEKYHSFYVNKYKDKIFYDDNLRKMDEYNYKLISEIYNSSISVLKESTLNNFESTLIIADPKNWIKERLENNKEYSYSNLLEIFEKEFLDKGIILNGFTIKEYFPSFIKVRRTKSSKRETYYKFI